MNVERVVIIVIGMFFAIGIYEGLRSARRKPPKRRDE
jgi:hypothetical protein